MTGSTEQADLTAAAVLEVLKGQLTQDIKGGATEIVQVLAYASGLVSRLALAGKGGRTTEVLAATRTYAEGLRVELSTSWLSKLHAIAETLIAAGAQGLIRAIERSGR